MTKTRSNPREVPPERKTMGDPSLFGVLNKFGCSCGQYVGVVLSN